MMTKPDDMIPPPFPPPTKPPTTLHRRCEHCHTQDDGRPECWGGLRGAHLSHTTLTHFARTCELCGATEGDGRPGCLESDPPQHRFMQLIPPPFPPPTKPAGK